MINTKWGEVITSFRALVTLVIQVGFVVIALRALKELRIERFFRRPPASLPLLVVLVAIAIGYACASFFTNFFTTLSSILGLL